MLNYKILNLILRLGGMALRMSTIFILAALTDNEVFVWYGVAVVAANYSLYIIGFDIYNFANREYALNKEGSGSVLKNQFSFYSCIYIFILIISFPLLNSYAFVNDSKYLSFLFVLIVVSEHIFIECYRVFIFKKRQLLASFLYFSKAGMFLLSLCFFDLLARAISYEEVVYAWLVSNVICIILAFLKEEVFLFALINPRINSNWIKKALVFSFPLLLSALCSKAIFTFDRIIVAEYLNSVEAAGYILIISIVFALNNVLDAIFFSFKVPYLMDAYSNNKFKECSRSYVKKGWLGTLILSMLLFSSLPLLSTIFTEKLKAVSLLDYFLCSLVFLFFNFSQIYHYLLYALGHSKVIFEAQLYSFILVSVLFYFISEFELWLSIFIALVFCYFVACSFIKLFFFLKIKL